MGFSSKRGRPPQARRANDSGTPELMAKRRASLTTEPIDLCLQRGLITQQQHWCAIHLRWLYTIRYGAPDVRAVDPTHLGGIEIHVNDPSWQAMREAELHEALIALSSIACRELLLHVCIYNEALPQGVHMLAKFREGLDALRDMWER